MGASRKLQGEIDRVLKKVQEGVDVFESIWNKVYDTENVNQKEKFEADLKKEIKKLQRYRDQIKTWLQSSEIKDKRALMDARKQIEREMERFKICEKETKTKAFSKEGLVQQPKTDPKEKAKSETRDWINSVVGELASQIENFEAEIESLSAKKGKAKTVRLEHLETSITRHKAHIMKLELLLRLLDNEELSPDQVNDVKDFLYDYMERNQDDFDDFSNVDELYSTLPPDKMESLEDLVTVGTSALIKGIGSLSGSTSPLALKNSSTSSTIQIAGSQDQSDETSSLESNSDVVPRTPPKDVSGSVVSSSSHGIGSGTGSGPNASAAAAAAGNTSSGNLVNVSTVTAVLPTPGSARALSENTPIGGAPGINLSLAKEDDNVNLLSRKPSPAPSEINIGCGVGRSSLVGIVSNPPSSNSSMTLGSIGSFHGAVTLGTVPSISDATKRTVQGADEKSVAGNPAQSILSPQTSKLFLQQATKPIDNYGVIDTGNASENPVIGGRIFSPPAIGGMQWRSPNMNSLQNQSEMSQVRGRTEIAPDQREKYLQRFQQVQQQNASNPLTMPHLPGVGQKPFYSSQQNPLLQQLSSQNSPVSSQVGSATLPLGISSASSPQPQTPFLQHFSQQSTILRDIGQVKIEDQQLISSEGLNGEPPMVSTSNNLLGEDDLKSPLRASSAASISESFQQHKDVDLSLGQPTASNQSGTAPGVIGRRATSDLGAIGDNVNGSFGFSGGPPDQNFNLQLLESAYYKLPQPRDSERVKTYIPRHPAATPSSYPQAPSALFDNPAFWERLSLENGGTDTLFFAFYHQQKTHQQYLAARELKRQSWRYHKKYNTWFQRYEEPKITTDDYEQGTYVYFDFHIADDGLQNGWCQKIKNDFRFEYNFLEDELPV